jgi:23S rRNA pseudoU1915 N3-methylase RlmH
VGSTDLATWTGQWDQDGKDVALVIGGADGLPGALLARLNGCEPLGAHVSAGWLV